MGAETSRWYNTMILAGQTEKVGVPWWYNAADQGDEPNIYPGFIPVTDVRRRLLNWQAEEAQMYRATGLDGQSFVQVPGRKLIVRSDTGAVLGAFRDGYRIHQYDEWLIGGIANLVDTNSTDLGIRSAGLLDGGAVAWVQIETPETVEAAEGFRHRPFLLAYTSHSGKFATSYMLGDQVVVCDNTLHVATNSGEAQFRVRHSQNSDLRLPEAREALGMLFSYTDAFNAEIQRLVDWKVTDADLVKFLDEWAPVAESGKGRPRQERRRETLDLLWKSDERVAPWAGTALGVAQLANTWNQHYRPARNVERVERTMLNTLSGKGAEEDQGVLRLLAAVQR
jgi:phage/plasmid-like protein (TIGR03299 family)